MGWTYGYGTRREVIKYAIKPQRSGSSRSSTLRWCCRGNVIYILREQKVVGRPDQRFIEVWLLQNGGERDGWGYKNMDESCGPYYYNCPLSYFEDASHPVYYAKEWREDCRKHQGEPKRKPKPKYKTASFSISDPRTPDLIDEVASDIDTSYEIRSCVENGVLSILGNVNASVFSDIFEKIETKE